MAIEVIYSIDIDSGAPYLEVVDDGNIFIHTQLQFPYDDIPTSNLESLLSQLRVIYQDSLNEALNASDENIVRTSIRVRDIGDKLNKLIYTLYSRPDYTPPIP